MKVLLDCDVLLDVAIGRVDFVADSRSVLDWCEQHPSRGCVAWHTLANIYYMLRRSHDEPSKRQFIQDLLVFVEVVATGTAQAKHALALPMTDFEDAMQTAAAVEAGVDYIITRNISDYQNSPIPAISPTDFLAQAPP